MSFYVTAPAGQLVLGIYDSVNGGPGQLLASTGAFTPVAGWNTQPVASPVALAAGTYSIAYFSNNNALTFESSPTGTYYTESLTMAGSLPSDFVATSTSATGNWSFYATLSPGGSPAPSPTPMPTPTPSPTPTPGTGKPGLKLFGGIQDFYDDRASYVSPDPLWKPISQGAATGDQFPSNWWRDRENLGMNGWYNFQSQFVGWWQTAESYCAANGINGPTIQLYYPPLSPASESTWEAMITALAPYCRSGSYEIAVNEVLGNNGNIQNTDPFLISLGGTGSTGWDALIALVKLEHQYLPGALLGLNETGVCDYSGGTSFFNQAACIAAYKACYNAGVPLDWLGCEGYWGNQSPGLAATKSAVDYVGGKILPYLSGKCGTAFMAFTEWTPMLYWGAKEYPTQIACWQAWLTMFANDPYIFGVTGPWSSFRKSNAFSPKAGVAPVDWLYNDLHDGTVSPDGTTADITPALTWLQGWVPSNVHP